MASINKLFAKCPTCASISRATRDKGCTVVVSVLFVRQVASADREFGEKMEYRSLALARADHRPRLRQVGCLSIHMCSMCMNASAGGEFRAGRYAHSARFWDSRYCTNINYLWRSSSYSPMRHLYSSGSNGGYCYTMLQRHRKHTVRYSTSMAISIHSYVCMLGRYVRTYARMDYYMCCFEITGRCDRSLSRTNSLCAC